MLHIQPNSLNLSLITCTYLLHEQRSIFSKYEIGIFFFELMLDILNERAFKHHQPMDLFEDFVGLISKDMNDKSIVITLLAGNMCLSVSKLSNDSSKSHLLNLI